QRWLGDLVTWVRQCEFHRGFVEVIEAEACDFVAHGNFQEPLRVLRLKNLHAAEAEKLAALPVLAWVRELHVKPTVLKEEG
ncbi:hypothetical protein NL529_33375, partial [Klebsiella pneumoniae]|nr:hypothetical protein [Klebsiella pneumoniae]